MTVDGLKPATLEGFGGLNVAADQEELGFAGAIQALNVELEPGKVRARDGTSLFLTAANNIVLAAPYVDPVNGRYLAIATTGATNNLGTYRYDGTLVGLAATLPGTGLANSIASAHIGTPFGNYLYVMANSNPSAFRYDSTGWNPVTLPAANVLAVTPFDNRLVAAAITGGYSSRVQFSDNDSGQEWKPNTFYKAGTILTHTGSRYSVIADYTSPATFNTTNLLGLVPAAESFQSNNWVDLQPGDGEQIVDMAVYGNQLYVFKRDKFFIFYGTSTDATGQPIFNYRTVDSGVGCMSWHCAAAGRDGVYFLHDSGVYRTSGSTAVKVSQPLDPFFRGIAQRQFLSSEVLDPTRGAHVSFVKDRLYVQVNHATTPGGTSTPVVFVYDPALDAWTYRTAPGAVPVTGRVVVTEVQASSSVNDSTSVVMAAGTGVYRVDKTLSTDNGVAFTTAYQSGFSDLGQPAREKTIRETELVGTGSPQLAWARDFQDPDSPQSVPLGTTTSRELDRRARYGELLSYQLSGPGPWEVRRIVPMLRETGGVGAES